MHMDLFRRNQKWIFIIVAIIIIPSFVLVWGSGGLFSQTGQQRQQEFSVGVVNGTSIPYHEYENFRKRISAAISGLPLVFEGAPGAGTRAQDLYTYFFAYALLQDAIKAGTDVSDLQIGTYLANGHQAIASMYNRNDPASMERAVDTVCRQMQLSRQEFMQGVREWQTIGNYVLADANLLAVNPQTVYTYYAFNRAQLEVKRIRVAPTEAIRTQARKDVLEKPAADFDAAVVAYAGGKAADPRYRTQPLWKFDWVFVPRTAAENVAQPTDDEIQAQYDQGRSYLYAGQSLDDVRDAIAEQLLARETERQTLRNINIDIDPQLRSQGAAMPVDELVKLTQIAKYGATAGSTGPDLLAAADLAGKLPKGAEIELRVILEALDSSEPEVRDAFMKDWQEGFNLNLRPFKADDGWYRLHLTGYQPSAPIPVTGADGAVDPKIRETAVADMIADRVDELVREEAIAMEQRLRQYTAAKEKGEQTDAELEEYLASVNPETIPYDRIPDGQYELGRLVVGDILGPVPFAAGPDSGQEILLLTDRFIPSKADFEAEPQQIKDNFRQMVFANFRGNYGFNFTVNGPAAVIHPSPMILGGMADRFNRGLIQVNRDLLANLINEG